MPKVLIGNVAGPQGPKGDTGKQGPEGPQGPQGPQGDINAGSTVSFTEALERENIKSGESCATIFGKIKKFFTDLKTVAFTGSYTDLSNKPEIVNNLASTSAGKVLDARQGKALDEAKLNKADVVNNLVTTEAGKALDARQGKALDDKIIEVDGKIKPFSGYEGATTSYTPKKDGFLMVDYRPADSNTNIVITTYDTTVNSMVVGSGISTSGSRVNYTIPCIKGHAYRTDRSLAQGTLTCRFMAK